ncbi:MAG: hypothetical protein IRY83_14905 [Chloroflexi bacterium]|nr:hypothetical protein [Chloroflexota bacterium]
MSAIDLANEIEAIKRQWEALAATCPRPGVPDSCPLSTRAQLDQLHARAESLRIQLKQAGGDAAADLSESMTAAQYASWLAAHAAELAAIPSGSGSDGDGSPGAGGVPDVAAVPWYDVPLALVQSGAQIVARAANALTGPEAQARGQAWYRLLVPALLAWGAAHFLARGLRVKVGR